MPCPVTARHEKQLSVTFLASLGRTAEPLPSPLFFVLPSAFNQPTPVVALLNLLQPASSLFLALFPKIGPRDDSAPERVVHGCWRNQGPDTRGTEAGINGHIGETEATGGLNQEAST